MGTYGRAICQWWREGSGRSWTLLATMASPLPCISGQAHSIIVSCTGFPHVLCMTTGLYVKQMPRCGPSASVAGSSFRKWRQASCCGCHQDVAHVAQATMRQTLECSGVQASAALFGKPTMSSSPRIQVLPVPLAFPQICLNCSCGVWDARIPPDKALPRGMSHGLRLHAVEICAHAENCAMQALRTGSSCTCCTTI